MQKEVISTDNAPAPIGSYSQAIKSQGLVFLSGQIALDPTTGNMNNQSFEAEMTQVFNNLQAVCEASGGSLKNVIKFTIYLTDLSLFPQVNEFMKKILADPFPARVTVGVASLPKNATIEIDAILSN